jgi:single-stranded-DNA-specific exonuclease
MEPYGPDNNQPVFISRNVQDTGWSRILKGEHIRFSLHQEHTTINGIGFCMSDRFPLLLEKRPLDIVFTIDENEWNGNSSMQMRVIDFRLSEPVMN